MASVGFRWLDILEKEFDKAFVDLDLAIGELEPEEPDIVYNVRQKLCTLSSCFAQLTHKAQTIFQNSAKIEAELIHMRTELAESKSKREILEQELHNLLLQLHTIQLSQLPALSNGTYKQDQPDVNSIKKKLEEELKRSPSHTVSSPIENEELKFNPAMLELSQLKHEKTQLEAENSSLRNSILALNSEVYGAKLAAKYLDKELAGRIQQLQLLGREMRCDVRDKLWRQLESEILLQRHKTVVRECRRNSVMSNTESSRNKPEAPTITENGENFGDIRTVVVKRKPTQGLGISITGGREHGVPILISELEANGPAALCGQLYIGDAILSIDDTDLRHACHNYAVEVLKQPSEESRLQVQYVAADDSDNSLEEDGYNFRIFDRDVVSPTDSVSLHPLTTTGMNKTPTAPRTPDSSSQCGNRLADGFVTRDAPILYNETFIIDQVIGTLGRTDISNLSTDTNLIRLDTTECEAVCAGFGKSTVTEVTESDLKKLPNLNDELHCSTNSLISENLSSPMQTSTDMFLDSEILSTDSQSPKNIEKKPESSVFHDFLTYSKNTYRSSSSTKSDQSLLNSADSCESSPIHKANRDYKKVQRRYKPKKYFGVKTLQSIFSKHGGYSDVSTTPSDCGDEPVIPNPTESCYKEIGTENESENGNLIEIDSNKNTVISSPETTQQFEENIHSILSEMFRRNFDIQKLDPAQTSKNIRKSLRVGKALRLCPNEDAAYAQFDNDQKREKLLARYVYNANCLNGDGVGDPDFGTPV